MSSDSLNSWAASPLITSSSVEDVMFPIARWKKQGRTEPSSSTTAETQGALQVGAWGVSWPRCSRKRRAIFRSLAAGSRMNLWSMPAWYWRINCSISSSRAFSSSRFRAISPCFSAGHRSGRLNASDVRSAARKEMESRPSARAASTVWRR